MEKVCAVRVIAESDAMQEFLTDRLEEDGDQGPAVDLKVLLPDREVVTVTVPKAASVKDVYDAVCCRVGLDAETAKYFYLFEIVEYNFGMRPSRVRVNLRDVFCDLTYDLTLCCREEAAASRAPPYFVHSELLDCQRDVFGDQEMAFQCK